MNVPINMYLLLDSNAVSMCNYCPPKKVGEKSVFDLKILKKLIEYANFREYVISFVHGDILPKVYYDILASCKRQTNIMGLALFEKLSSVPNVTVSLDAGDYLQINKRRLSEDLNRSASVHFKCESISFLADAVISLLRVCRRVTIVCDDASYFEAETYMYYQDELKKISDVLKHEISHGKLTEINVLTDSVFLDNPHPCPSGVSSFAFSPDGKLYPCPAFIGDLEFEIPFTFESSIYNENERFFSLRPICQDCTQYHCRRCAFTNYQFTKELCIPPYEVCKIAKAEEQASKSILKD